MAYDPTALDASFAALQAFDWGKDANAFKQIDEAVVGAHSEAAIRADLEKRFGALLGAGTSRAAKEYVCRKLAMIGTAVSVPALAALLPDAENSHMARFALERMGAPEAAESLRKALGTVQGNLVIGMISSLAARGDKASVPAIAKLLGGEKAIAAAAAEALGTIGSSEAAAALAEAKPADPAVAAAIVDARLACADALLAAGDKAGAKAIFAAIKGAVGEDSKTNRDRAVRIAASRGLLAAS